MTWQVDMANMVGFFSLPVETIIYRIVQEALTNVLRHARAAEVKLELKRIEEGVQLCVEDDGIGFDPNRLPGDPTKRHLGLISMRERAEMLGGMLDVFTAPNEGTMIRVFIPLQEVIDT